MADEAIISYSEDIVVKVRHNAEVYLELAQQGPQGPQGEKGDLGDVTPAVLDARDQAVAAGNLAAEARNAAEAAEENALILKNAAQLSADNARESEIKAELSNQNADIGRRDAMAARADAIQAAEDANSSAAFADTVKAEVVAAVARASDSEVNAKTSETNSKASENSAAMSAEDAVGSANAAADILDQIEANEAISLEARDEAARFAAAALASEANAKTSENNSKAAEELTFSASVDVENAKTLVLDARDRTFEARDAAQASQVATETAKGLTEAARDAAQNAEDGAEAAVADAEAARDAASEFADAAAKSAADAAKFDPSSYPMKINNGSDYTDPAQFRINIGAATAFEDASQADAEAGTSTSLLNWSPERVRQAIAAYAAARDHKHTVADITDLQAALDAMLIDAYLSGTPTVDTAAPGDRSKAVANTEYVRKALDDLVGAAPGTLDTLQEIADALGDDPNFASTITQQIATKADAGHKHLMADITDLAAALGLLATKANPTFTGTVSVPTAPANSNGADAASTEWVNRAINNAGLATEGHKHEISDTNGLQAALDNKSDKGHAHVAADITDLAALLNAKANLASPAFTGNPTVPTQAVGNNSTRAASTAFVVTALANGLAGKSDTGHGHVIVDIDGLQAALDQLAKLDSAALTGTPTAPTAPSGTSTTQIATTGFAVGEAAKKLDLTGGNLTGKLTIFAPAADTPASMNLAPGVQPTTLVAGDLWNTSAGLNMYIGGSVRTFYHAGNLGAMSQAEAEAGTSTTNRILSAQRIRQAVLAGGFVIRATIPTAADLNTYTTPGLYHQQANANASAGTNYPVNLAGMLTVTADGSMVYQTYTAYNSGRTFSRALYQTTWSAWIEFSAVGHGHAISDISGLQTALDAKLNAAGGTISGDVTVNGKVSLGSVTASAVNDLSKHIALYGSTYGFAITGNTLNYVSASVHQWTAGANVRMTLDSSGNLTATGNITAYSDERLKSDIVTIAGALDLVDRLRGVRFTMNGRRGLGVIAQELQKVAPELVVEADNEDKTLSVAYGNIAGILIEAIKELRAEVQELKEAA